MYSRTMAAAHAADDYLEEEAAGAGVDVCEERGRQRRFEQTETSWYLRELSLDRQSARFAMRTGRYVRTGECCSLTGIAPFDQTPVFTL
jgi:hypothetical protein